MVVETKVSFGEPSTLILLGASSLSEQLQIGYAHTLESNRTSVMLFEKNTRCRKILERLVILHILRQLCNLGPSIEISDMWSACFPCVCALLADIS